MVPLTATERAELRNAAISANLANPFSRQALFANVHPAFVPPFRSPGAGE